MLSANHLLSLPSCRRTTSTSPLQRDTTTMFPKCSTRFNTIGNVGTQDRQVECFVNASAHLAPAGLFVVEVEVEVPDLRRLPPGRNTQVFKHTQRHLSFDELDVATQLATPFHIRSTASAH